MSTVFNIGAKLLPWLNRFVSIPKTNFIVKKFLIKMIFDSVAIVWLSLCQLWSGIFVSLHNEAKMKYNF